MSVKDRFGKAIMDKRTCVAILILLILWRALISINGEITLWESVCSGIVLIVMGWVLFAFVFIMSQEMQGWLKLNMVYRWIAICVSTINVYVIVYYGMRWYRLAGIGGIEEALVPLDFIFRDIRYLVLVVFYCVVLRLAQYLRDVYEDYMLLFKGDPTV
jgi:hypothetical protein